MDNYLIFYTIKSEGSKGRPRQKDHTVNAVSFADAEYKTIKEVSDKYYLKKEINITAIHKRT